MMSVVVTTPFRFCTIVTGLSLAALCTWLVAPMPAQGGASGDWAARPRGPQLPFLAARPAFGLK